MKNYLKPWLVTAACSFGTIFSAISVTAQMKIGNHPTQINKASILELESNQQGLLLTRIEDTASMTALNPPDGMIIYSIKDSTLLIRSGYEWKKLTGSGGAVPGAFWNMAGNPGTDSAGNFLGTSDAMGLRIGTNNTPAIVISRSGTVELLDSLSIQGNTRFGRSVNITDSLSVAGVANIGDSMTLHTVRQALPSDSEVLVISAEGVIRKIAIDSLKSMLSASAVSLRLNLDTVALSQGKNGPWIDSISKKTDSIIVLNLPDAAIGVRGLISDSAQAIAGPKSFRDSLAVGTAGKANSSLQVNGNVSMATVVLNSGNDYNMNDAAKANCRTVVVDVTNLSGEYTVELPTAGNNLNGRIYTIKKIGKDDDAQLDNNIKITPTGGDTFEDAATAYYIYNNFTAVTF